MMWPAIAPGSAIVAAAPTECDRLAGSPQDPRRAADGVGFVRLDAAKALEACAKDLAAAPHDARLQFDSGRAREKAGDLQAAAQLYRASAGQAYPAAQVSLAKLYWHGSGGLSRDLGEADRLLKLAIAAGDFEARRTRYLLFVNDLKDDTLAFVRRIADAGDADANYYLAVRAISPSNGHEADIVPLLRKASDLGSAAATVGLGEQYFLGQVGLPRDPTTARALLKRAAEDDDPSARCQVGMHYKQGDSGMPQDDREAARLFKPSSDQGDPDAQYELGLFYDAGRGGLARDPVAAARLWALAVDQGNGGAALELGKYTLHGLGGLTADKVAAARLFKTAADHGSDEAKAELAKLGTAQ